MLIQCKAYEEKKIKKKSSLLEKQIKFARHLVGRARLLGKERQICKATAGSLA